MDTTSEVNYIDADSRHDIDQISESDVTITDDPEDMFVKKFLTVFHKLGNRRVQMKVSHEIISRPAQKSLTKSQKLVKNRFQGWIENWKVAMEEAMDFLSKNHPWEIVPKPKEGNIISSKWVFKTKTNTQGGVSRYKAKLVARGYSQKYCTD